MSTVKSFAFALALTAAHTTAAAETPVDVELMLAVDVSYSMSLPELEIQRRGYATALRDPEIWSAIAGGYYKRIALTYVEWSGAAQQRVITPWTLIRSPADLDRFAASLTINPATALRRTSISGLLDYAPGSFERNAFVGDRRVIDVSGDGPNNMGRPVAPARDALVAAGYEINGLPLMTRDGRGMLPDLIDLNLYYEECVIGGPLSFAIPVHSWEEFLPAVRMKLIMELAGVQPNPELVQATVSGANADGYDCLIGEKIWRQYIGDDF
ncbi:MAG: DUF1194 domain-containing protein [Pseudomonadota bacterium]